MKLMVLVCIFSDAVSQDYKFPVPSKPESGKILLILKLVDSDTKKPVIIKGIKGPMIYIKRENSTQGGGLMPAGDGVYHAKDVEPGEVTISVKCDNYARWVKGNVELKADEKMEITVELVKGKTFSGKIGIDDKVKFRQIAVVYPEPCKEDHSMVNNEGAFTFKDLTPGVYKFEATNKKFKNFYFWMRVDSDIKDFEVKNLIEAEKDSSVSISISEKETGNVIDKGTVTFKFKALNGDAEITVPFKDSSLQHTIPHGKLKLKVTATGYKACEQEVEVLEGQAMVNIDMEK